jgi:hypothetical protein
MNVESITDDTHIKLRSSGANVTVDQGDRLITTNEVPTLYSDSNATISIANPAITDNQGLVEFYTPETKFDIIVNDILYIDNEGGWIKGGGVTVNANDYSTIQAAINALSSSLRGEVRIPVGTYVITSTIVLATSNIHLRGERGFTTIQCNNNAIDMVRVEAFGCSFDGINFLGPGTTSSETIGRGIFFYKASTDVGNASVTNCTFDGTGSWGIEFDSDSGGNSNYVNRIEDCNFLNAKAGGSLRYGGRSGGGFGTTLWCSRNHFHGPAFGTMGAGINRGAVHLHTTANASFNQCYWENFNCSGCISMEACSNVNLFGCGMELSNGSGDARHWMITNTGNSVNLIMVGGTVSRQSGTDGVRLLKPEPVGTPSTLRRGCLSHYHLSSSTIVGTDDIVLGAATDEMILMNNRYICLGTGTESPLIYTDNDNIQIFNNAAGAASTPAGRWHMPRATNTAALATPVEGDLMWDKSGDAFHKLRYYSGGAWRTVIGV